MDGGTESAIRAVPTFQIVRGLPQGRGYAREIARRHDGMKTRQIN